MQSMVISMVDNIYSVVTILLKCLISFYGQMNMVIFSMKMALKCNTSWVLMKDHKNDTS